MLIFLLLNYAQTTMRSEIGQLTLDRTLAELSQLNVNIVRVINELQLLGEFFVCTMKLETFILQSKW